MPSASATSRRRLDGPDLGRSGAAPGRRVSAGTSCRRSRRRRRRPRASRRVAGGVEEARAARRRALPDPPALVVVERRRLGRERRRQPSRAATSGAIAPRARPRSRSCTGSSGRRSRSPAPPRRVAWRQGRWRLRVSAACHRPRGVSHMATRAIGRSRSALTRRPAGRRSAGPWRRPASRPARPGRRPTSSIAWSWPRSASNGAVRRDRMARAARAPRRRRRRVARLEADLDRRREVAGGLDEPARRGDGGRDVDAAIDERRDDLGVDLRLGVAAHRAGHDPRPGSPSRNSIPGKQRVERPLARREDVRVARVEAEVAAAVLVVDAGRRIDHAGPEAQVVGLDEADRVAVGVDGGEVDRAAAARVASRRRAGRPRRGSIRAGELRGVGRVEAADRPGCRGTPGRSGARRGRPSRASLPRSRGGSSAGPSTPSGPNAVGGGASNRSRMSGSPGRPDPRCSAGGSSPGRPGSRWRSGSPQVEV